jgi:hypothetical protein
MALEAGGRVRLIEARNGMAEGAEGILIGWYGFSGDVVVSFWDGGPLRVPESSIRAVAMAQGEQRASD